MTSSPLPRSVSSTGNIRAAFVLASGDPLQVASLAAAFDVTFHLTGAGYTPTINENSSADSRLGQRQNLSKRGSFSEELALEYVFGGDANGLDSQLPEGTAGFLVIRRGIPNEMDWAAGQKVTVHSVECGKQQLQPPGENTLDTIKQALYATALTSYLVPISTGGTAPAVDLALLTESGDFLALETGDLLLTA